MRIDFPPGATPRHAVQRTRSGLAGPVKALAVVLAVVLVSSVSIAAYGAWSLTRAVAANAVDIGGRSSLAAIDGAFNVLLVGADNAPGQSTWGASRQATLNDVNILVHVAADHRSGVVVSLPRDLVIDQPACVDPSTKEVGAAVTQEPLNTSFARGGLSCVVNTVEHQTGVQIPYAALFSFEGTVKMADAVGGVPVCVTSAIDDPKSGLRLPAGRSVISGRTALAYLRSRHGVGDGSDLSRIGSQQAYMSSLMRTMMSSNTFTNPTRLYGLASAAAQNVQLSTSMANVETIVHMAVALKDMNLQHLVFVQYPTGEDPYDSAKVVPDTALAGRLMWRVRTDRPVALDASSLGLSTRLAAPAKKKAASTAPSSSSSTSSSGASSTAKRTSSPVIGGLRGQTAAQQTCSIAAQ